MTEAADFLWWRTRRADVPADSRWIPIGLESFQEKESGVTGRHRLPGHVPDWAEDLFRVARAAFIADKHVCRSRSADRWTRRIRLCVPVTDPDRWQTAAHSHLNSLLQTLTADTWQVDFRPLSGAHLQDALVHPDDPRASEVALFSGGLDSLSWAAARARAHDPRPLLLVMFREVDLLPLQQRVYQAVKNLRAVLRPVCLLRMSQTPAGKSIPRGLETSSRTRGLLYAAGAIRAATAHGVRTVHIPENGQLALNPPLTPARAAALSTRSVHPWTLAHMNAVVAMVSDPETAVRVVNPLAHMTKGDVCTAARNACLSKRDLEDTLSCGRPPARQRGRERVANCGFCFPCLVRRSGLLRANDADDTPYKADPWDIDLKQQRGTDWRALQRWLLTPYTLEDLLADTPLPQGTDTAAALDVVTRGRQELERLVRAAEARGDA